LVRLRLCARCHGQRHEDNSSKAWGRTGKHGMSVRAVALLACCCHTPGYTLR
jgi:hypothetical protein